MREYLKDGEEKIESAGVLVALFDELDHMQAFEMIDAVFPVVLKFLLQEN